MMSQIKSLVVTVLVLVVAGVQLAHSALTIDITSGSGGGVPIAIVPFEWKGSVPPPQEVSAIIESNLVRSGKFDAISKNDFLEAPHDNSQVSYKNWRLLKAEALILGQLRTISPDKYEARFQLLDVYKEKQLAGYQFVVSGKQLRKVAHQISDIIYETLTGNPGAFDTKIAYVTVTKSASGGNNNLLVVADSDGYGPREVLSSKDPIISPAWSKDGQKLAYVSFENGGSKIFVQDVFSGKRVRVANFPGLNSAPAWSPDGSKLALTLSRDGNPEIYVMRVSDGTLQRITRHHAIDTEPSWAPDGKSLVFTSDRAGKPQIYQVSASGGAAKRLTFEGAYNARASYDSTGKKLVLVTNQGNGFQIGVFYPGNGGLQVLTQSRLDESPSFAPNGDMILYATQTGGKGILAAVSSDGRVKQRLRFLDGSVREPAWSPFNRKL